MAKKWKFEDNSCLVYNKVTKIPSGWKVEVK